jgi:predicted P-loop ATPase
MRDRKASLIAATNHDRFIRESEGDRRYLAVNLAGTVNLNDNPLPYEGAYAQALWLLDNGFCPKPNQEESQMISNHNLPYLMPDDVTEALLTFVRMPEDIDNPEAYSAGDLLRELNTRGFHGRGFTTTAIGRAMKSIGFEAKKYRGTYKYIAVLADYDRQQRERKQDAEEDTVMPF